jgi:hypothetical protein
LAILPMSLLWFRDQKGYTAKRVQRKQTIAPPPGPPSFFGRQVRVGPTIFTEHVPETRDVIVRNGYKNNNKPELERIKLQRTPLWRELLRQPRNASGALDFVSTYGFLLHPQRQSEDVSEIIKIMDALKELDAAALREDWDFLNLWLIHNKKLIPTRLTIEHDPETGREILVHTPEDLRAALFLQLLRDRTHCVTFADCERKGCLNSFYYGPGTGRRESAKFCSDPCRVKSFELKRIEEAQRGKRR